MLIYYYLSIGNLDRSTIVYVHYTLNPGVQIQGEWGDSSHQKFRPILQINICFHPPL